ncbi:hypothetical protein CAPTEDRAFT_224064 [Capitella teleta]|uniref:Uncharacterized protein n=1 Tax=Capitella teleta TaxID=283909 RepID=R7TGN9_CAPTE|nr:hypothetical protein CAPTEDRAFT_224064 [Capitella teleta]|eukprot:ELT92844.1 hypothetical protein CAPTEDRAFT_224064 [Capitella teleta]
MVGTSPKLSHNELLWDKLKSVIPHHRPSNRELIQGCNNIPLGRVESLIEKFSPKILSCVIDVIHFAAFVIDKICLCFQTMASSTNTDITLCDNCFNDEFELFEQTELGDGEMLITCSMCGLPANADLWQETLANKLSSTSTSDEIRDQLMASAKEYVKEVEPDEVLPICFKIPCKCGSKDFRNVTDEEGMSTLAHVKVCSRCHHVMGVDESVLLEEAKEFLSKASFKTTKCTRCGNTNPDEYRFETGSGGTPVIRCIRNGCSEIVKKGSREQGRPAPVVSNPNACGPNLGFNHLSVDGPSVGSAEKVLSTGETLLRSIAKGSKRAMAFAGVVFIDLASLATSIADLRKARNEGQIPQSTYVNGIVEEVGKTGARLLVAGAACLLPIPIRIGLTIGYCLGALLAPAAGRALVWVKDKTQEMIKNMRL